MDWRLTATAEHRAQTRAEILDAARVSISVRGADATSLGAVARHAGCAPTVLYRYFSSREDILLELYSAARREWVGRLATALDGRRLPPMELGRLVAETVEAAGPYGELLAHLRENLLITANPDPLVRCLESLAPVEDQLLDLLATALPDAPRPVLLATVVGIDAFVVRQASCWPSLGPLEASDLVRPGQRARMGGLAGLVGMLLLGATRVPDHSA